MGFKLNPTTLELDLVGSSSSGGITSVNGDTGPAVVLDAADVGADPAGTAQTLFDQLGDKYVRTTRFEIINSGTSGSVTLPANSTVVLDDFGGTVDAVISQVTSGKPNLTPAVTATNEVIATTFNSSGNWSLSGTPSSYPVAILYRVRQTLENFDSDASNIFGNSTIESDIIVPAVQDALDLKASLHPNNGIEIYDNFLGTTAAGNLGWTVTTNTGSVGLNASAGDGSIMGIIRLDTSINATSAPTLSLGNGTSLVLGVNTLTVEFMGQIPVLSTGTEEFSIRWGLHNSVTSTNPTNGVYFSYDRTQSTNWRLVARRNNVETVTTSSTAVTAGAWLRFKIVINAAGTQAEYFINGTSIGTVSGAGVLPTTTSFTVSPTFQMVKSVGTTSRVSYIDWFYMKMVYGV